MNDQDPLHEPKFNSPAQAPPASAQSGPPQYLLNNVEESAPTMSTVKSSGKAGRFAVGGLVAAMAVGGAFAARTALTGPTGPASSDEAVTQMFEALDNDDFVGVAELIHPAERESLAQPVFEMIDHYARLEIIASSVDTSSSSFTDIEVDGVTYSVEATGPRLHWITTTGGTITSNANFEPPAGALMDRLEIDTPEVEPELVTEDLASEPLSFAVVEVDGSWYVSLWYSLAETIRREEGDAFAGLGNGPAPVGAASPDAVMEDMIRRIADFDGEGVLTLIDPEEAAALYDYSPYFLGDMNEALADAKTALQEEEISWTIDSIDFVANEQNGRQIVSFSSMAMTIDVQGDTASVDIGDGCLVAEYDGETVDTCDSENEFGQMSVDIGEELKELLNLSPASLAALEKLNAVDAGITAVERDGRWYASIMPTVLGTVNDHLAVLESSDLEALYNDLQDLEDDPEALLERFDDMTGGLATGALNEINPLGSGQMQFESVADDISGGTDGSDPFDDDSNFDDGPQIANLLPDYFSIDITEDLTYLSAAGDLSDAPAFVAAKLLFGDDQGSIEVVEFENPVEPSVLTQRGWVLREVGGVVYATNDGWSNSYAFVENFVIWASNDDESVAMLMAQIELLK